MASRRWRGTPFIFVLLKQIGRRYRPWGLRQALMTRRKAIVSALGAAAAAASTFPVVRAFAQGSSQATASAASAKKLSSLREPVSVPDYELLAHECMSHPAWEYINSGSADEVTLRWNREALTRIRLKPRVMVDVSQVDTRIELFGQEMSHPILLAPTSTHMLEHPEGEVAIPCAVRGRPTQ
jgi:4-hydroxymandelate oxidase